MGNMVDHARHELEMLGEDKPTIEKYLRVVKEFEDMADSGAVIDLIIPVLTKLFALENLKPLTNNPAEWEDRSKESGVPLWQNKRNTRYFSTNGGATMYNVDEASAMHGEGTQSVL